MKGDSLSIKIPWCAVFDAVLISTLIHIQYLFLKDMPNILIPDVIQASGLRDLPMKTSSRGGGRHTSKINHEITHLSAERLVRL